MKPPTNYHSYHIYYHSFIKAALKVTVNIIEQRVQPRVVTGTS